MITVDNIHKSFDGVPVLQGLSLHVEAGEFVALIGRSGYGKSVLLRHIAGMLRPDSGQIVVDGQNLHTLRGAQLQALRARFGFVFQGGALFDSMTVFDNVAFPLREKTKEGETEIAERVHNALGRVGLVDAGEKFPAQISGGMVKRTALARALVLEPEFLFFDEPTTGLDPMTGQAILNLIDSCHRNLKYTGIIVTHQIPRVFDIVDKVAVLHEGTIRFFGPPEELAESADEVVRQLVTGTVDNPV
ncbi:MAG: ATP-binding cassette domain-containing protein [Lentisphaeria bacterium]|nr:ATP-binding cassette domain-containing protein [Lentisphaeria bacterium]